jgi:toxin YoeB
MKLIFAAAAWEVYLFWQQKVKRMIGRINKLVKEVQREPFTGIGKPEPLKHALSMYWSRRITDEHRMVYRLDGDALLIAQLRYRYKVSDLKLQVKDGPLAGKRKGLEVLKQW